ncbi:MAG: hypothetical protein ACRYGB_04895 [Janthinobacterium lividum]
MPNFKLYSLKIFLLIILFLLACNQKNNLRHYQIQVIPDSVVFGRNKAVILAIKNMKAADVINQLENDTSIKISYNLEVTNNNPIKGSYVFVNPSNFRLVLDNHHKLTHAFYNSMGTDPQSTTISTGNIFDLPAKTKPVALDLFFADSVIRIKILLH